MDPGTDLKPPAPDKLAGNIEFAAQELLAAPIEQRQAMLEVIAKSLTRLLLSEQPGIGSHEVSNRVTCFINAVHRRIDEAEPSGNER
jgi:hypothetical protein